MFERREIRTQIRMSFLLYTLFAIMMGWLLASKVDVVVTAYGTLRSDNVEHFVQSARAGYLSKVLVANGAQVTRGDTLVEYDCSLEQKQSELLSYENLRGQRQLGKLLSMAAAAMPNDQVEVLQTRYASRAAPLPPVFQNEVARYRASLKEMEDRFATESELARLEVELAQVRVQSTSRQHKAAAVAHKRNVELVEHGTRSAAQLEVTQDVLDNTADARASAALYLRQAHLKLDSLRQTYQEARDTLQRDIVEGLEETDMRLTSIFQKQASLEAQIRLCTITAPTSGTMFWHPYVSFERFVKSGETLGKIIRAGTPLMAEAVLPENNIAFVNPRQQAILRINGLPFVRYGTLAGEVTFVSPDTVNNAKVYSVHLLVDNTAEWLAETGIELVPGMAIEADIIVGKRRVIEYFTDPIQRAFKTAFREI